MKKKNALGKGLDIIFSENTLESDGVSTLKTNEIEPNRTQPRKDFDAQALRELADSIAIHGVIQPIMVRPILSGGYEIVAGERRWRACRMAGVNEIPVIIREMNDKEYMQIALVENLQREDLNAMEEANGYASLMDEHELTQEEVASAVGKSRSAIANTLRLISLPDYIKEMIQQGEISAGHGRTLLGFKNAIDMKKAAELAKNGMSVRELEKLQKRLNQEPKEATEKIRNKLFVETELAIATHLGRKIKVDGNKKKGFLQIEFYGDEDLKSLIEQLSLDK